MTIHYVDPSAWVKRHFQEPGSDAVNGLFRAPIKAACCSVGLVEMLATVARKCAQASVEPAVVGSLVESIRTDFAAFRVIALDDAMIGAACDLALRHRLRAIDAVHLACAMSLREGDEVVLVSADSELLAAAAQAGIASIDPSHMGTTGN